MNENNTLATRIHYTCVMHIEWSDDTCGDECARLTFEWNNRTEHTEV